MHSRVFAATQSPSRVPATASPYPSPAARPQWRLVLAPL